MQISSSLLTSVALALSLHGISASPIQKRDGPLKKGQVAFGLLPDDGSGSGGDSKTNMQELNALLGGGGTAATYGYYAQVTGPTFDGSQLLQVFDDVKASGAIFEPAIMPTGGFSSGYFGDNTQLASDIGDVIKKFTDAGIEVRVRFGHEINYYLHDSSDRGDGKNTYPGGVSQETADNFKKAFAGVRSALNEKTGGKAKMFYTPNVSSNQDEYTMYMPDLSDFDFCGIDYYPQSSSGLGSFASTMKSFHDICTAQGAKFAIGETGLGYAANDDERISWLKETLDGPNNGLTNLVSVTWFNYYKDNHDYRVVDSQDASITDQTKAIFGI